MGRLLDLGVIGNYDTPSNDTTQTTGYRQLAPGKGCRSPAYLGSAHCPVA